MRGWLRAQQLEREWWERVARGASPHTPPTIEGSVEAAHRVLAEHGIVAGALHGRSVLEIGPGPAGITAGLCEIHRESADPPRLIAADPLLDFYQERFGLLDPSRVELIAVAAERLPIEDSTIDLVYCGNALDHVDDPEACVRELARVLRPDGICALSVHVLLSSLRAVAPVLRRVDPMHPNHFTIGAISRILHRHFAHVELRQRDRLPRGVSWKVTAAALLMRRAVFDCSHYGGGAPRAVGRDGTARRCWREDVRSDR